MAELVAYFNKRGLALAGTLATLAGLLFGFASIPDNFHPNLPVPAWSFSAAATASLASILATGVTLLFWYLARYFSLNAITNVSIVVQLARTEDAKAISRLGGLLMSVPVSEAELVKMFMLVNPHTFYVARKRKQTASGRIVSELVGYSCLLPLRKSTYEAFVRGEANGLTVRRDDLCSGGEEPHAVWVGAIVSKSPFAAGRLFQRCLDQIAAIGAKDGTIVMSRAATPRGRSRMDKYGFVENPDTVHHGSGPILECPLSTLKRHLEEDG